MGKLIMVFYLLLSPDTAHPLYLQFVTFLTFENISGFLFSLQITFPIYKNIIVYLVKSER